MDSLKWYWLSLFLITYQANGQKIGWDGDDSFFSPKQVEEINKRCQLLKRNHQLSVIIKTVPFSASEKKALFDTNKGNGLLVLSIANEARDISFETSSLSLEQVYYFERLVHQWLKSNTDESKLIYCLLKMLEQSDKDLAGERQAKARINPFGEEEFSPQAKQTIKWLLYVIGVSFVVSIYRSVKSSSKNGEFQFYGASRMSNWVVVVIAITVGTGSIWLLYHFIFYYEELIVVLLIYVFAFPFFVVIACQVVMSIKDFWKVLFLEKASGRYSVAQVSLMVTPRLTGEELLERNFYQLIIRGQISFEYDSLNSSSNSPVILLNKSSQANEGEVTRDQLPIIQAFIEDKMRLEDYLEQLCKRIGSFKAYKKDWVSMELLKKGDLYGILWIFNFFIAKRGLPILLKIRAKIDYTNKLVGHLIDGKRTEEISRLDTYTLAVSRFDEKLDALFNSFTLNGLSSSLRETRLAPFFKAEFSFDHFSKKLNRTYQSNRGYLDWFSS